MASREEQKRKAREERERKEREEQESKRKKKKRFFILGGAALLLIIVIVVVVVVTSSSSKKTPAGTTVGPGLQVSTGPWDPEYNELPQRLKMLQLPQTSDVIFHIHANLEVYADGKKMPVPAQIGIDQQHQLLASLHTHDTSGTIHMEAVQPYPFKLGQFFDVWGVRFTATQLGAYHSGNGLVLLTWVNGKDI